MISIDGSFGEGGGQILRTSIAFSALSQRAVKIFNIRANRQPPGLKAQHLHAVEALGRLCGAEIKGAKIGSKEIEFYPKKIKYEKLNVDIGTAGSITLVLQALMIPAIYSEKELKIQLRGGTDVKWSPSIDYLKFVTLPLLKKFGYLGDIKLIQRGYYPEGGGKVLVEIKPIEKLKKVDLIERGKILSLGGISHAHFALEKAKVTRRQVKAARSLLYGKLSLLNPKIEIRIAQEYCDTPSYGSGITLWLKTENSILGADSLGEKGKSSEIVGQEVANELLKEIESNAPLDKHMADQIVPYLALAGGSIKVSEITEHAKTNVEIVNKFGYNLKIEENVISQD